MKVKFSHLVITLFCLFFSFNKANTTINTSEDVTIVTEDQVKLKGTYYSADKPGPGILLLHMCMEGGDRRTWTKLAGMLVNEGFHVLTFDFRGYYESEGEWPNFTTMQEFIKVSRTTIMKDVEAAYEFLISQESVNKESIGLAGASCGVFMGIEASFNHPEIRALALISGPFDDQAREQLESLDNVPVLSAACQDDVRAFEAMKRVFAATKHPNSTLIQYKGSEHGTNIFNKEPDFERTIVEWFKRWL